MQFDMGTSISLYFPPSGTAGFERSRVNGKSREPAPPPSTTATTFSFTAMNFSVKRNLKNGQQKTENGKWKMVNGEQFEPADKVQNTKDSSPFTIRRSLSLVLCGTGPR